MSGELQDVAEAFSRKALLYDAFGEGHDNLARMRAKVRRQALRCLRPGDRILELNAGTGADAAFFARQGFSVHATDLAGGMVARIASKREQHGLQDRLTVQQCSFFDLEQVSGGPFDYVFSNMGGVNCAADLEQVAHGVQGLIRPGGYCTWVVMPPVCLWELAQVFRGDFKTGLRRLDPRGNLAHVEGVRFMTYYYTPGQVIRAFGSAFQPVSLQGLSVFTPAADQKAFPHHHPRLYRLLRALDERLADRPPFREWGDFFILTMRFRGEGNRG
jgi:ubiquinone/menaquinone biosynthesis C-methylase UbiE